MRRRIDVRLLRATHGEAQRMIDDTGFSFLAACQPCQNRQASGVGGCPAIGAQGVRAEVKDRAAARRPFFGIFIIFQREEFIQNAVGRLHDQSMMVAACFNRHIVRDGIRPNVALISIIKVDFACPLAGIDGRPGDTVIWIFAKVGVEIVRPIGVDVVDVDIREWVNRRVGDVGIPGVIRRE